MLFYNYKGERSEPENFSEKSKFYTPFASFKCIFTIEFFLHLWKVGGQAPLPPPGSYGHVKSTDSVKYLGLQIDKFLDCERIVLSIVQKVNARLKFLYRHANVLNTQSRITLTSALIQCHFDYSCSSWFGGISKTLKQKLQVAQNKVVRFMLDLKPRDSITCDILDSLKMLRVDNRVKQLRLNHVHNIVMAVHHLI